MPVHLENSIITGNKIALNHLVWYNWVVEKQLKPEAHAMNKSITQDNQNDKQISTSIRRFFTRFHVSSALKAANAYKKKGVPVMEISLYMFLLIFSNRSMYMNLQMFRTMLSDNTELSDKKSTNWRVHLWIHFRPCWKYGCKLHKVWTLTTE